MNELANFITNLENDGFILKLEEGNIVVDGPCINGQVIEEIRKEKPSIIRLLQSRDNSNVVDLEKWFLTHSPKPKDQLLGLCYLCSSDLFKQAYYSAVDGVELCGRPDNKDSCFSKYEISRKEQINLPNDFGKKQRE